MAVVGALARWYFKAAAGSWARAGWRPMQVVRSARERGWKIRYQDMLNMYREKTGMYKRESLIKAWPSDRLPHRGLMTEVELKRPRKYLVLGDIDYYDWETGKRSKESAQVYDDELRNYVDWEKQMVDTQFVNPSEPQKSVVHFTPRVIMHNKGWSY